MMKKRLSLKEYSEQLIKWAEDRMDREERAVVVGVSNRHIHLDRTDMDILFGKGTELTPIKDLRQPGQYAAQETVILRGPKGEIGKVRVLGPLRPETQIEISVADGFVLGVEQTVRESGDLEGTPGIEIIGPKGSVRKEKGVIVARRHIHMLPHEAAAYGLSDKEVISVELDGPRGAVLNQVLVRVTNTSALEMHIDIEEANALGIKNGDLAYMILPPIVE